MNFIPNDREPVYLQIIRYIKQQVVTGNLNPGDTIPSRREMAQLLKVNPNTVQKSYKEMEEMGIIKTIKSYQSSVTTDENIINQIRHDLINESMEIFIENMKAINVGKEELIEIINDKY
nr:GntR family transcriptional regulator [uncultured Romboutsia sp.]